MERTVTDFPPGTRVRVWTHGETRRQMGVGTVVAPEGPLAATGRLVLVALPPHDGFPAMPWWFRPEQLEPAGAGEG